MKEVLPILNSVKKDGRNVLLEHEVYSIFNSIGIKTPKYQFVPFKGKYDHSVKMSTEEVVVKVVSPEILHKTELGGVVFCKNIGSEIEKAIEDIRKKTGKYNVHGFIVVEKISYKNTFGNEVIASVRNSRDFGTIIGFGVGGIDTEFFGKSMNNAFSVLSGEHKKLSTDMIRNNAAYCKLAGLDRVGKRLISEQIIEDTLNRLNELGKYFSYDNKNSNFVISECEINPIVVSGGEFFAIDGLMKIENKPTFLAPRPVEKLEKLFHPKSIAVIGVSEKFMNMGRIILNNVINRDFPKDRMFVIKADTKEIDGIKCVPTISELPYKVDLLVLAVGANVAGEVVKESINSNKIESVIIIPGGFAEKEGGEKLEQNIVELIQESRKTKDKGPILVGGNCLGIVSNPGRYDTFFIPTKKMPYSTPKPYAFISQSGAFIISKISKTDLTPQYSVSIGNQMDLTVSDYLAFFLDKPEIKVIALYVEGFKDLDGIKTASYIKKLREQGKDIMIYKGGRSSAGKSAASGHTASIAGEYPVYRAVMQDAGALVVESFMDFEDILKIMIGFVDYKISGNNIAIISNAGFETVGMADNLGTTGLAKLSSDTVKEITSILADAKIDNLVTAGNPLDITPVANDKIYVGCLKALLKDKSVSAGVVSCIPMTPALKSIKEELGTESMFNMIEEYSKTSDKPFVVVVDSGELYDPACKVIKNVPVFRESDRAIKALSRYIEYKRNC
ncbi:MAG: acetate--CoA ligase family protein [Proteobacteria bacterium]|nr:acetate--CoA ligase family protein [Pseudomonadota bacterium]